MSSSSPFGQMRGWDQTASIDWQNNRILVIFRRKLDHLENTSQCAGVSLQFHCREACVIVIILCSWYPSSQNASMCPARSGTASHFTAGPWGSGRGRGQDLGARICSFLWSCQKQWMCSLERRQSPRLTGVGHWHSPSFGSLSCPWWPRT